MLMTEEQARTKWCPHARQSWENYPTYNRMEDGAASEGCLCIASGCMAWQSQDDETVTVSVIVDDVDGQEGPPPDGDGWVKNVRTGINEKRRGRWWVRREPNHNRRGYCGAFGKAEG